MGKEERERAQRLGQFFSCLYLFVLALKSLSVILFKNIINLFLTSGEDTDKLAELEICLGIISSQEDRDTFNWKERIHC